MGYVGLVSAVCLADLGHDVLGVDVDADRIGGLRRGEPPLREPQLRELLVECSASGKLHFATASEADYSEIDVVLLCLPTPQGPGGECDVSALQQAVADLGPRFWWPTKVPPTLTTTGKKRSSRRG